MSTYEVTFTGKVRINTEDFDGLGEAQMAAAYAIALTCRAATTPTGQVNPCSVYHKLQLNVGINSFEEVSEFSLN